MDFDEIAYEIAAYRTKIVKIMGEEGRSYRYGWAVMLDEDAPVLIDSSDIVYFARSSQFNRIPSDMLDRKLFVVLLDEPLAPLSATMTVVACADRRSYREIFELLSEEFHALSVLRQHILGLTASVSKGIGLTRITNQIAKLFGTEASVLDSSMNVLAYSSDFPDALDPADLFDVTSKLTIPAAGMERLKEEHLINKRKVTNKPTIFPYTNAAGVECTNHFTFISIGDTPVGSFSLIKEGGPLRRSRIELLPSVAHVLSAELQKSSSVMLNKSSGYARLLTRLANGTIEPEEFSYALDKFGYALKRYMRVMYADTALSAQGDTGIRAFAEQVRHSVLNCIYTAQEGFVFFLVSNEQLPPEHDDALEAIDDIARKHDVKIGVSSPYTDAGKTPLLLEEARRAIMLGEKLEPSRSVHFFSDFQLLDLFERLSEPSELELYCYPPFMRLMTEDAQHDTHLAETLLAFIDSSQNADQIAADLFIHKNTLYYRLEKARSIMGVDFKDADTIMRIKLTEHILSYLRLHSQTAENGYRASQG